ncbi:MAG TPA: hypothetical protein VIN59_01295 [Alphaproteobacteria bacterium]
MFESITRLFGASTQSPSRKSESLHHPGQPAGTSIRDLLDAPKGQDLFAEVAKANSAAEWELAHPKPSSKPV